MVPFEDFKDGKIAVEYNKVKLNVKVTEIAPDVFAYLRQLDKID